MGKKNHTYVRYLLKEKHKRQYTLTKTKLLVGFFLSLVVSVFLGSYFDRYGDVILHQTFRTIVEVVSESVEESAEKPGAKQEQSIQSPTDIVSDDQPRIEMLTTRLKQLEVAPTQSAAEQSARMSEPEHHAER